MLLMASMTVGMLAGCGGGDGDSAEDATEDMADSQGGGSQAASQDADFSKHLTISAWVYTDDDDDNLMENFNENPAVQYLSKKFNVTFDWQIPPTGSETDNFNLMVGSGETTDVFNVLYSTQSVASLYEDGVILDMAPYVEKYAPNLKAFIEADETRKKNAYTDNGELLYISKVPDEKIVMWGGLVYRRDILEAMTDGNVQFPSGKEAPETIEDWDYMLDLMKQYFDASGLTDTACLIIPSSGYFVTGEILMGFGVGGGHYIDNGQVKYGLLEDGFYNYLVKMKEWYEKGYVYQDFASRTTDLLYMPNPALTYSGAAGIWYGLQAQLGEALSVPEYNLQMNVQPMISPVDTEHNATSVNASSLQYESTGFRIGSDGWCISANADEDVVIRWMQICDYLFTEEGAMVKSYGLTAEQAEGIALYEKLGLTDGAYWFDDNGKFVYNPLLDPYSPDASYKEIGLRLERLPGLAIVRYSKEGTKEEYVAADKVWRTNGFSDLYPQEIEFTSEENNTMTALNTACSDYINSMVPKFIMGTEELTPESFEAFKNQIRSLGMDTIMEIYQAAYDKYVE